MIQNANLKIRIKSSSQDILLIAKDIITKMIREDKYLKTLMSIIRFNILINWILLHVRKCVRMITNIYSILLITG